MVDAVASGPAGRVGPFHNQGTARTHADQINADLLAFIRS
jgi:hypothetical protein